MAEVAGGMGQLFTILFMAFALGMDAFSLGIGLGMRGIRLLTILKISLVIGIFHVIMPLMGIFTGQYVGALLGDVAAMAGGGLLVLLGGHMVYSSLKGEEANAFDTNSLLGIILFALSVSIDSFSVGISFGLFASDLLLTVITFGIFGFLMSIIGLLLGRRVGPWFGGYGEAFGGVILLAFGLKFMI